MQPFPIASNLFNIDKTSTVIYSQKNQTQMNFLSKETIQCHTQNDYIFPEVKFRTMEFPSSAKLTKSWTCYRKQKSTICGGIQKLSADQLSWMNAILIKIYSCDIHGSFQSISQPNRIDNDLQWRYIDYLLREKFLQKGTQ